jgi:hypothetical protein
MPGKGVSVIDLCHQQAVHSSDQRDFLAMESIKSVKLEPDDKQKSVRCLSGYGSRNCRGSGGIERNDTFFDVPADLWVPSDIFYHVLYFVMNCAQ